MNEYFERTVADRKESEQDDGGEEFVPLRVATLAWRGIMICAYNRFRRERALDMLVGEDVQPTRNARDLAVGYRQ
jgi:hypothetical protein